MKILNDHLVFRTENPNMVLCTIPESKTAKDYVAVPYTMQNATVLRNLGYVNTPSPITYDYSWPGKYTPFKHQSHTAEFLTLNKRAFCLNGMGTGKTMATLWAADYLKRQGIVNRVLIISPLSTLDVVWGREIFTSFPHRTYNVLHGTAEKRRQLLKEPVDYYIINHHGVGVVADELKNRPDINLIIIDEAAFYRNSQNKSWKLLKTLLVPDKWVWGLTGSPTPQAPTDAYGIAKMIRPENTPFSFTKFKNDVMMQVGPFRWVPRKNAEQAVARILSPSLRYALRDCIDLPPTMVQYRKVELTPDQEKHYKKLLKEAVTEVKGIQVTAVNAAVLFGRLLQAASGCLYGADGEVVKLDVSTRMAEVEEILEECDEKVIVFVPFTGALQAVKSELVQKGYEVGLIDGSTSKGERQRVFDEFQFGDKMKVLVANAQTMSHGVTLTAASTIVWFAPTVSNEIYEQANARIVRPGQTCTTNVINIVGTPVEEKIYKGLIEKKKFLDTVLEIVRDQK